MPGAHSTTSTASYGIDVKATGIAHSSNDGNARYTLNTLANQQSNLLIHMHDTGELDGMITRAQNGEPIGEGVWGRLLNPVHARSIDSKSYYRSDFYGPDGQNESLKRHNAPVYDDGTEIGPLLLLAPGDINQMVKAGKLSSEEADALKILRGVYLATGSKAKAETALQNYYKLNEDDQKYFVNHMFSPDAVLQGTYEEKKGGGSLNDIKHAHITYNSMYEYQEQDTEDMIYFLTELDPETYETLGGADTSVFAKLSGDRCEVGSTYSYVPFNRQAFVENLEGGDVSETETGQLESIETTLGYGGSLRSLSGTDLQNLNKILGKHVEKNYGFAALYSGDPDSKTSTTLMMALGVESATQTSVVQLQQLLDKTSLDPSQKENVFNYFVSNGQNTDTTGDGQVQLDKDLNAFLNDPAVNDVAEDWMEETFALAKVQSGDTKSAWTLRAEAGATDPATGSTDAQLIEEDPSLSDPIIGPGSDPTQNPSLILYHVLSGTASQEELDAAANKTKYGLWDAPPLPDVNSIPYAAKIQMDADNLTQDQERMAAQIYDVIAGASSIPENKKSALFSYILTGGKEPEQSADMDMDALVTNLKSDLSVTTQDADLVDAIIGGTPFYEPDQLEDSYVTDKVWNGFAQNDEGFDGDPYTQVDVTQENARAALDHMKDLGLSEEEMTDLTDRMVNEKLTESDITLLKAHETDVTLEEGDRDVILSAISNSNGVVPIPTNADKGFKDEEIDTAFSHLHFGATNYTPDDIAQLKKAAKEGTMTPDQVALLMVNSDQGTLTPDDKVTLLSACNYSHRVAYAAHGEQWEAEVEAKNDDNHDGVIGDPYQDAMSPEKCYESGMGYDQIVNLGSLFFEVMIDRMQSLDSTVRAYADAVKQKNQAIANMNAALECVPPEPAGSSPTVDVSTLSFTYTYTVTDPETGQSTDMEKTMKLTDYLKQEGIKLPTADGSTSLDATQLSSLRQSMSNQATSWGSDSALAAAQFQDAMSKYNTCVSQLSSFLPKWYDMCTKAFTGR